MKNAKKITIIDNPPPKFATGTHAERKEKHATDLHVGLHDQPRGQRRQRQPYYSNHVLVRQDGGF